MLQAPVEPRGDSELLAKEAICVFHDDPGHSECAVARIRCRSHNRHCQDEGHSQKLTEASEECGACDIRDTVELTQPHYIKHIANTAMVTRTGAKW